MIQSSKGIIISYVDEKGGAAEAGLKGMTQDQYGRIYIGDVLLSVDGQPVNNLDDIYQVIDKKKIGDLVDVSYRRDGKTFSAKVKLKAL
jgi:S1-C subfamily serine protease